MRKIKTFAFLIFTFHVSYRTRCEKLVFQYCLRTWNGVLNIINDKAIQTEGNFNQLTVEKNSHS